MALAALHLRRDSLSSQEIDLGGDHFHFDPSCRARGRFDAGQRLRGAVARRDTDSPRERTQASAAASRSS